VYSLVAISGTFFHLLVIVGIIHEPTDIFTLLASKSK